MNTDSPQPPIHIALIGDYDREVIAHQPERAALAGTIPPLVSTFLKACARDRA